MTKRTKTKTMANMIANAEFVDFIFLRF